MHEFFAAAAFSVAAVAAFAAFPAATLALVTFGVATPAHGR